MPYNNTPIAPSQEVSGQVSLPLARVQKIIHADLSSPHVSKNASFAIALATEMFIQHLATTTHNVVKAERKPRRNIQYRDVASAVAKTDNLEFLVDVAPRTMQFKEYKKKREAAGKGTEIGIASAMVNGKGKGKAGEGSGEVAVNGETNGNGVKENGHVEDKGDETESAEEEVEQVAVEVQAEAPEPMDVDDDATLSAKEDEDEEEDPAAKQIEMEMRGPRANGSSPAARRTSGFTAINGSR